MSFTKLSNTTDEIYDTMMQNLQHGQFDIEKVTESEVNSNIGEILFTYDGRNYQIALTDITD